MFISISYLLYRLWQEYPVKLVGKAPSALLVQTFRSRKLWPVAAAVILLAIAAGFGYHTAAFALLVLIMAGLVAVKTLARRQEGSGPELFALLMLGVALALGIGVEFLKVNLVDPGRMNTVFKFYFHAWTLMALASALLCVAAWGDGDSASAHCPTGRVDRGLGHPHCRRAGLPHRRHAQSGPSIVSRTLPSP